MSGYFGNTEAEQKIKINEYLKTLDEQIEIDDTNLQANKNYLLNGVLPQSTQMVDTRTTSEKLADFEKLKKDIADEFTGVFEPNISYQIVEKLISSPLNYDNKLLVFLAQNAPEFVKTLKKKYKYGVRGDANDIETIVQIISDLYNEIKGNLQSVKDFTTKGYKNIGLTRGEMGYILENLFKIKNEILKSKRFIANDEVKNSMNELITDFEKIQKRIFTDEALNSIQSSIQSNGQYLSSKGKTNLIEIYYDFIKSLPPFNSIKSLLNNIENASNLKNVNDIINRVRSLISIPLKLINDNPYYFDWIKNNTNVNVQNIEETMNRNVKRQDRETTAEEEKQIRADLIANNIDPEMIDRYKNHRQSYEMYMLYLKGSNPERYKLIKSIVEDRDYNINQYLDKLVGHGISGSGLSRRGRPRKEKPKSEKIEKYIGFGINEVNAKKLNEKSVMTIRRKNKSNFMNIPSRVVGEKLKTAIQSIIGGKMPDYKTLNGLTDDEKNYLHKIMSVSGLTEKFAVPTPSKDSIEKDIHEFEVMKGEILSGNDSKELIRKFKLLIVKLARSSVLPRNDVNELLLLLADLNY